MGFAAIKRSLGRDRLGWGVGAIVAGAVLLVLGLSAWHLTPDGWVSGGWNWSDFLLHVSIGSSIAAGNFPPQVPYFAGVPLTYHWFADFHGAIISTAVSASPTSSQPNIALKLAGMICWVMNQNSTAEMTPETITPL